MHTMTQRQIEKQRRYWNMKLAEAALERGDVKTATELFAKATGKPVVTETPGAMFRARAREMLYVAGGIAVALCAVAILWAIASAGAN